MKSATLGLVRWYASSPSISRARPGSVAASTEGSRASTEAGEAWLRAHSSRESRLSRWGASGAVKPGRGREEEVEVEVEVVVEEGGGEEEDGGP